MVAAYKVTSETAPEQTCPGCGESFPYTEDNFGQKGDRLNSRCRPCLRAYHHVRNLTARLGHEPTYVELLANLEQGHRYIDSEWVYVTLRLQEIKSSVPALLTIIRDGYATEYWPDGAA